MPTRFISDTDFAQLVFDSTAEGFRIAQRATVDESHTLFREWVEVLEKLHIEAANYLGVKP